MDSVIWDFVESSISSGSGLSFPTIATSGSKVIMAGSPVRAPLPNLLFPQSGDKSPPITGSGAHNSSPILSDMVTGSPTYPRFAEGPFCASNVRSASPQPPAKKRCLEPKQHSTSGEGEGLTAPSQPTHECSSDSLCTSASSFSSKGDQQPQLPQPLPPRIKNGAEESPSSKPQQPPQQQQESESSKDLPHYPPLPLWGDVVPDSANSRIAMLPKNFPPLFPSGRAAAVTPSMPAITTTTNSDPVPLGASALAAAAAMAINPLFQQSSGGGLVPGSTASPWNPMLAAAAAAFASGGFQPPGLPSRLQGDAEGPEEKDGGSSSRSGSPMLLSGAGSSVEGVEVMPDASQAGHHWTFQEQFKQLYELSSDPKRKEFLDDLFNFMQKRGSPVNRIPIMAKQVLDLYELYRLVVTRGGLVEVINKKLWREITKGLQLPSSITSAAFTLRTQYMKYLYPYEYEKLALSTPSELQAAIDGNRREARRSSYSFEYPMLMGPSSSAGAQSGTAGQPLSNTSLGATFSHPPPPHHSLLAPPPPPPPPPNVSASCGPSLLPSGLLLPPGFPTPNSGRNGSIFPDTHFFGFPSLVVPTSTTVVRPPTPTPPAAFDAKSYFDDDQLVKQKRSKYPQRCLSSSSTTMVTAAASPKPRPNSKPNYSSPATLESDLKSEANRYLKPMKLSTLPKCTSAFDLDQRHSPQETPSPRLPTNVEVPDKSQQSAATQFSEFLKQRLPLNDVGTTSNCNFSRSDLMQPLALTIPMQNAYQQFMSSTVQKLGLAEKKDSMNGCVEDRRQAKPTATPRENGDFPASNIQLAPNLRISTKAGDQLGLPENTLVVCMEVNGVVYQGVLFGRIKPLS
ncbi:AT-rich interactive domain-containing protein 3A [Echinococcus granulosus]|nr:AT-rich interactive domain-containing protein 3A [Echinococcus granulosus]